MKIKNITKLKGFFMVVACLLLAVVMVVHEHYTEYPYRKGGHLLDGNFKTPVYNCGYGAGN